MKTKYTNSLINETSPYLLHHAHNPVEWFAWGEKALQKAKNEDKLILVSVGYSACHWCHVMAHESFEDEEVAQLMNKYFVNIKIDREERPDVDQVYMNAVQLITGRGGWPLNCFALPDGRPIYGGTYFRKPQWIHVLKSLVNSWKNEKQKLIDAGNTLHENLKSVDVVSLSEYSDDFNPDFLNEVVELWKTNFDYEEGGFAGAPKFPLPGTHNFLLRYFFTERYPEIKKFIELSLKKMAYGGIFDQLAGGFARYSVDAIWKVPHFEKMLYDNGQLVSLYAKAYSLSKNNLYKDLVFKTLDFIENELTSPNGAFYSSLDADSEGAEGKFYVWTESEIDDLLKENLNLYKEYYSISPKGNWENSQNILMRTRKNEFYTKKFKVSAEALKEIIKINDKILLNARNKRIHPGLDDKILCSWNALMLSGYVSAYKAFAEEKFLALAEKNAEFILSNLLQTDGSLHRTYKNGVSKISGFLDDYAFFIQALLELYEVTMKEKYLKNALELTNYVKQHFYDSKTQMFFYTPDTNTELLSRKPDLTDNVIPSANSVMAINLYFLSIYFDKPDFMQQSKQMLKNVEDRLVSYNRFKYNWDYLYSLIANKSEEIVVIGENAQQILKELHSRFLPGVLVCGSSTKSDLPIFKDRHKKDKTLIYRCKNNTCELPVENLEALNL